MPITPPGAKRPCGTIGQGRPKGTTCKVPPELVPWILGRAAATWQVGAYTYWFSLTRIAKNLYKSKRLKVSRWVIRKIIMQHDPALWARRPHKPFLNYQLAMRGQRYKPKDTKTYDTCKYCGHPIKSPNHDITHHIKKTKLIYTSDDWMAL